MPKGFGNFARPGKTTGSGGGDKTPPPPPGGPPGGDGELNCDREVLNNDQIFEDNESPQWMKALIASFFLVVGIDLIRSVYRRISGDNEATEMTQGLQHIDWNTFKHEILAKGECSHIEIFPSLELAVLHLADGALVGGRRTSNQRFVLRPPDIDAFEHLIRETETDLGIPPSKGVSIVYQRNDSEVHSSIQSNHLDQPSHCLERGVDAVHNGWTLHDPAPADDSEDGQRRSGRDVQHWRDDGRDEESSLPGSE